MSEMSDLCKIWSKFESKKQDGSIIKLRIQSWPLQPEDDVYEFIMTHFVADEAIHKASGIARSGEAIKEYRELMNIFFHVAPLHAMVCCPDNDSNTVETILGASIVQLMRNTDKLEDITKDFPKPPSGSIIRSAPCHHSIALSFDDLGPGDRVVSIYEKILSKKPTSKARDFKMEFKTAEMQQLLYAAKVLEGYLKEKLSFETFYFGRGIIVHPDSRRLGIANEFIKARKLLCIDNNIPMTCAGMSATGTQKAADKNNWKTLVDIPVEELEEKTGLKFEKNVKSHKIMYTTIG